MNLSVQYALHLLQCVIIPKTKESDMEPQRSSRNFNLTIRNNNNNLYCALDTKEGVT